MATRIGFEPTISALTGQYVNHYTTGPHRCAASLRNVNFRQQPVRLSNQPRRVGRPALVGIQATRALFVRRQDQPSAGPSNRERPAVSRISGSNRHHQRTASNQLSIGRGSTLSTLLVTTDRLAPRSCCPTPGPPVAPSRRPANDGAPSPRASHRPE